MKITKKWLKKNSACNDAINDFENYQGDKSIIPLLREMICKNRLEWANWLIVRVMTPTQSVQYAIFAAEQVINLFEVKYPTDKRPRKALEVAKRYLTNPPAAAADAAAAAYAAAAADAAAYAAAAAADATAAAAAADATAAAAAEMKTLILRHGITLLGG